MPKRIDLVQQAPGLNSTHRNLRNQVPLICRCSDVIIHGRSCRYTLDICDNGACRKKCGWQQSKRSGDDELSSCLYSSNTLCPIFVTMIPDMIRASLFHLRQHPETARRDPFRMRIQLGLANLERTEADHVPSRPFGDEEHGVFSTVIKVIEQNHQ